MEIFSIILTVVGLIIFETISSIDNAVINAEVLSTMSQRARKMVPDLWFIYCGFCCKGNASMAYRMGNKSGSWTC